MTHLSQLDEDTAMQVIALPFKSAILISHADDVDGEGDDEAEMDSIKKGLAMVSARYADTSLSGEVVKNLLQMQEKWPIWEGQSYHALKEAPSIMDEVQSKFGKEEAKQYRAFIMELSEMVAKAHSEFAAFDDGSSKKAEGFFAKIMGMLCGSSCSKNNAGDPANISPAEKSMLDQLSSALHIAE